MTCLLVNRGRVNNVNATHYSLSFTIQKSLDEFLLKVDSLALHLALEDELSCGRVLLNQWNIVKNVISVVVCINQHFASTEKPLLGVVSVWETVISDRPIAFH